MSRPSHSWHRRRARRLSLAALLLLLPSVTQELAAAAEPVAVGEAARLEVGPVLAGSSLLFAEQTPKYYAVRLAGPRARTRTLARETLPSSSEDFGAEHPGVYSGERITLAASTARIAYTHAYGRGNARYGVNESGTSLFTGHSAGPLAQLATCSSQQEPFYTPFSGALSVDADTVAYTACDGALVIRDSRAGAPVPLRTIPQPAGFRVGKVALAGRYVAYLRSAIGLDPNSGARTVVADWLAGREIYNVPPEEHFDVDADGNLAVASFSGPISCATGRLFWYSIAQPTPHALGHRPCRGGVKIAGGRIAADLDAGGGHRALALLDLSGRRRDVTALGREGVQRGDADFDGSRLSYALGNCGGRSDLLVAKANSAEAPRRVSTSCPVRIRSRRLGLAAGDRNVRVSIACPRGCAGKARLERRVRGGGRTRTVTLGATRGFRIGATRCRRALEIALNGRGRRLLSAKRRLRARLVVETSDRSGRAQAKRASVALSLTGRGGAPTSTAGGC